MALCSDGTVAAWGAGTDGQLGDNSATQRNAPVAVSGTGALSGKTVTAIATGRFHTLALCADGTLAAWGRNTQGQLGDNTTIQRDLPVAVDRTTGASALAGRSVTALSESNEGVNSTASYGTAAPIPPVVGSPTFSSVTTTGATLGGNVTADGEATITERGVAYSPTALNSAPTIGGNGVIQVVASGRTGIFTVNASPLSPGMNYSFAAYATNSQGTTYSTTGTFTTLAPEIVVSGNTVIISNDDTSPALGDHTDFGNTATMGGTVVRTFTIQSTGTANLTLGSVVIGGPDASSFTVTAPPPTFVSAGQSATFQVTFDPSTVGLRTATLSFTTNDSDDNPFNFSIQGTAYSSTTEAEAANWAESYGLSAADATPTAEPFDDGVPNLLKYAFNMPLTGPNVSGLAPGTGNSGLPAITAPNTGSPPESIRVEFIRRRNSGLIYTPLYSINGLSNFIPMTAAETVTTIDANWERVVVTQPLGLPLPTTTFSQVSVTAQ